MRTGAVAEIEKQESFRNRLRSRLRSHWWVFLVPLYPLAWIWVSSVLLALFITEPIQWNYLNAADKSYVILQVHPFRAWPSKQPVGKFEGTELTRNLAGLLEAAEVIEVWVVPFHFQLARRLPDQFPVPPSIFLRPEIFSQ